MEGESLKVLIDKRAMEELETIHGIDAKAIYVEAVLYEVQLRLENMGRKIRPHVEILEDQLGL